MSCGCKAVFWTKILRFFECLVISTLFDLDQIIWFLSVPDLYELYLSNDMTDKKGLKSVKNFQTLQNSSHENLFKKILTVCDFNSKTEDLNVIIAW